MFRIAMGTQENRDSFLEKGTCHGVLTATKALLRSRHGVLTCFCEVLDYDSLRSHYAFTVLSRRSQCMHCAFTAFALRCWRVEDAVTSQRALYNLRANATDSHGVCIKTIVLFAPAELLLGTQHLIFMRSGSAFFGETIYSTLEPK